MTFKICFFFPPTLFKLFLYVSFQLCQLSSFLCSFLFYFFVICLSICIVFKCSSGYRRHCSRNRITTSCRHHTSICLSLELSLLVNSQIGFDSAFIYLCSIFNVLWNSSMLRVQRLSWAPKHSLRSFTTLSKQISSLFLFKTFTKFPIFYSFSVSILFSLNFVKLRFLLLCLFRLFFKSIIFILEPFNTIF